MAYEMYTTRGVVCGSYERGEHDRVLRILTEDAGMVSAVARGLRKSESKLRYALQDFSYSTISLVHGRREWRVTGAANIENFYFDTKMRLARGALLSYLKTVRRLVQGTESSTVFRMIVDSLDILSEVGDAHGVLIAELRLLDALGYVRVHDGISPLLNAPDLRAARAIVLSPSELAHIGHIIKESMKMSHL